jgi:hypothetical protein
VAAAAAIYYHPTLDLILINSVAAGLVIVALASLDLAVPPSWEEPFELIVGFWLAVSPVWLEYGDPLRIIHVVAGGVIMILAGNVHDELAGAMRSFRLGTCQAGFRLLGYHQYGRNETWCPSRTGLSLYGAHLAALLRG